MKKMMHTLAIKLGGLLACTALLAAASSVTSTCWFMSYQPDVPEELL